MKVYCEKCRFYCYTDFAETHFCERPEWMNVSSHYTEEDAIHWPRLEYQHHDNHYHAEKVNENNDCVLYKEKKSVSPIRWTAGFAGFCFVVFLLFKACVSLS